MTVRDWADAPLPAPVQARIGRAQARLALVAEQIAALDAQQLAVTRAADASSPHGRLVRLRGVATTSASVLLEEGLVWRAFKNRRQLGGLLGFAPVKYESGDASHDQGISRAGNDRLQSVMVQLAWSWVHWQPQSALARWYQARFGAGKRTRKVGDRRARAQALDRAVALGDAGHRADRRDRAAGVTAATSTLTCAARTVREGWATPSPPTRRGTVAHRVG